MKKGFTLIELMITIAIVGVLAKLAIVGYTSYAQRSNRALAIQALGQNAAKLEKYYSQNGQYITTNNAWPSGIIDDQVIGSGGRVYTLSYAPSGATSKFRQFFNLIAVPVAGTIQATDSAGKICISNLGVITQNAADDCGVSALIRPVFCAAGDYLPCSGVCQDGGPFSVCSGNCDRVKVCGNPVSPGCSGNCHDAIIEGPCSGECDRATLYVPNSMTNPCSGNCHNITIIRTD